SCMYLTPPLFSFFFLSLPALNLFGIVLYSVLTFMAAVSFIVYLEVCTYVYKKVPYPKKTNIIWINGAAPVIATMSCLGMWIPRATMFTDFTSNSYFAIVIYKFLILLFEECGGEEVFLRSSANKTIRISTGPCCCCCPCLPRKPITRRLLFLLKLGTLQYAVLKTALSILSVALWANGDFDVSTVSVAGAALWINLFVGVLTITALWPVGIMFMHIRNTLRSLKIIPKYAMYQLILVLSQLQSAIINILSINGVIACSPPFSSFARGSLFSQQLMIVEMFIITLVTRMLYKRMYEPIKLDPHESDNEMNVKISLNPNTEEEQTA
ncbi:hypothetical protein NFI96_032997, partial [Prochilodus magdalenae]